MNALIEEMILSKTFVISLLSIQELGFVLAKLGQSATFVSDKLETLMTAYPVAYGSEEFTRAMDWHVRLVLEILMIVFIPQLLNGIARIYIPVITKTSSVSIFIRFLGVRPNRR